MSGNLSIDDEFGVTTLVRPKSQSKAKKPRMFQVLLHNDDFTPREFVVAVLKKVFAKSENEASEVMLKAHSSGMARVAVYSFSVAETKAHKANDIGKANELPLHFSVEPVGDGNDD